MGLGSAGSRGGAGLNDWTIGLVVCPVFDLLYVLKEVGEGLLGLADTDLGLPLANGSCGFGLHDSSGLYPTRRVDSGLGLVWGLGASMGLIVGFPSTAKGLGVSRGLGPGTGLLGSGVIIWDWLMEGISIRLLLLESVKGLK